MRIAVVANTTWYLYNSRRSLMRSLADAGHQVIAVGQADAYVEKLTSLGIRHRGIPVLGASVNPFVELKTVFALRRIFREEGVELVLSYTPKGNIYSALASKARVALIPNVSGLGRVFVRPSLLTPLVKFLYRLAFGRARRVLFENNEDLELFAVSGLVARSKAERIPGSGVDLSRFAPCQREQREPFVFLLVARMLWDKGVGEYVQAARKLRATHPHVEFRLLGFLEVQNPSAIKREQMQAWEAEGVVRYLGATDDVVPQLCDANCVVLPSYSTLRWVS